MLIPIDNSKKFIDRGHGGDWFVSLPLQAGAHPEHFPAILGPDVSGLGKRPLMDDRWVVPLGPYFKEFNTLPGQAIADIEIFADMGRRASLGQELVQGVLDPLFLKVVEGHFSISRQ
jgi:hypothetical protein